MGTGPPGSGARGPEPSPAPRGGLAPPGPQRPLTKNRHRPRAQAAASPSCRRGRGPRRPGPGRAPTPRRRSHGGGGARPPPPAAPPAALPPPPSRPCPHTHFDAICVARAATGCRGRRRLLILRRLLRRLLLRRRLLLLLRRRLWRLAGRLLGSARCGRLRPVALRHLVPGRGPATAGLKRAPTASASPRRAAPSLARSPLAAGGGHARRGFVRCHGDEGAAMAGAGPRNSRLH